MSAPFLHAFTGDSWNTAIGANEQTRSSNSESGLHDGDWARREERVHNLAAVFRLGSLTHLARLEHEVREGGQEKITVCVAHRILDKDSAILYGAYVFRFFLPARDPWVAHKV